MIYTDCHLHSSFSGDSDTPMEDMIRRGIRLGLRTICFTDHMDPEFPESDVDFGLDTQAYASRLMELKDKYSFPGTRRRGPLISSSDPRIFSTARIPTTRKISHRQVIRKFIVPILNLSCIT